MVIQELSDDLINKIAAGEVIERPSNVVKELVENSLDAGAKKIVVEIVEGGKSLVKVTDDGVGMAREDATLCVKRHTTSKIANADDLFDIHTLGFRGEALASIASVASFVLITKQEGQIEGTRVEVSGGEKKAIQAIGCPVGTTVEVRNLFFNTPARKKYLKSIQTELANIVDIITRYSLANPHVHFTLIHNDKNVIVSPSTQDPLSNITSVYGRELTTHLIPVDYGKGGVVVKGFISKPSLTKGTRSHQSIFINNRYVKNKTISNAISDAYYTLVHAGEYPIVILNVTLSAGKIDVNVHPTKTEIRLMKEQEVHDAVVEAITLALKGEEHLIPEVGITPQFSFKNVSRKYPLPDSKQTLLNDAVTDESTRGAVGGAAIGGGSTGVTAAVGSAGMAVDGGLVSEANTSTSPVGTSADVDTVGAHATDVANKRASGNVDLKSQSEGLDGESKEASVAPQSKIPPMVFLGQIHKTYIVAEMNSGLCIIDQHAAEERVNYEKFMSSKKGGAVKVQQLLQPDVLELSPKDSVVLEAHMDLLKSLGFVIDPFGGQSFVVRAVPDIFGRMQSKELLETVINELHLSKNEQETIIEERIIKKACRASIKAGDVLTEPQMRVLLDQLGRCDIPFTCPHGRPTIINITLPELERKFKRVM